MRTFDFQLNGVVSLYGLDEDIQSLKKDAISKGLKFFYINGSGINSKQELFSEFASACNLPEYFGFNFDALEECIKNCDVNPSSGYIYYIENAKSLEKNLGSDYKILLEIFKNAATEMKSNGIYFFVVLN